MDNIKKTTLRNDVSLQIQQSIINSELKPGERLVETKIAKQLGVSQSPVREAIRELELMGLVEIKPYLGSYVKKITKGEIQEAYELRAYLEMYAANKAAQNVSEEQIDELSVILNKMKEAANLNNEKEFVEIDIEFHKKIIEFAKNSLLEFLWIRTNLSQWTFVTVKISGISLKELAERHDVILFHLKNHDSLNAEKTIKEHLEEAGKYIYSKILHHA